MLTLVANFKGGTGKSTVVFNLAVWLMAQGRTVKVYDLDPQRTLSDAAQVRAELGYEPALDIAHSLPARAPRAEGLIDVGVSDGDALHAAIRAAQRIVVPLSPSQADIWATQHFLDIVAAERKGKRRIPVLAFVNRADPHPRSREFVETVAALNLLPGIEPIKPKLIQRLAFRRSFSEGLAAFELEPGSKAAAELSKLAKALYE
ncbi:MAG TPA: ParA family protein [Rhodobacterales bacterium]|nr:ParA family protein [Rhodobacterales bacterium]